MNFNKMNNRNQLDIKDAYFYQKVGKEFVPIMDAEINIRAKKLLNKIYSEPEIYKIPNRFIDQWNDVVLYNAKGNFEKTNSILLKSAKSAYSFSNSLNDLLAKEWIPETVTVFTQKGLGSKNKDAQIEKLHPAPFSFQDVARHIKFFTKEGEKVIDPFVGVGSTLKACCFENRIGFGIELSKKYFKLSEKRIKEEVPNELKYKTKQTIINANAISAIEKLDDNYFDFLITSPPYWNILETKDHKANERFNNNLDTKYSDEEDDLGNIENYDKFLDTLSSFFCNCARIIKPNKYIVIIVSDFRKKEKYYLFHADLANSIESKSTFCLKGIKILYQRHKSIYPYGYPFSFVPNVHHQNVLILQNKK